MDVIRRVRQDLQSDEARARRHARRDLRERKIYAQLQDSMSEVEGSFSERLAGMWNIHRKDSTRKIEGHAGAAAAMYVSETFGEYNVSGTLKTRYAGMEREAGKGGHGITEGTILVDVELKPVHGMTQVVEVPVYVHDSYLQRPGLMYHQGAPLVIAQSSIDELMDQAKYGDRVDTDRRNLYTPPKIDVKTAGLEKEAGEKFRATRLIETYDDGEIEEGEILTVLGEDTLVGQPMMTTDKGDFDLGSWKQMLQDGTLKPALPTFPPQTRKGPAKGPRGPEQEAAREWLILNDPEGAAYWKSLPVGTDFVREKEQNLHDFGPEDDGLEHEGSIDAQGAPSGQMGQREMVQNMRPQEVQRQQNQQSLEAQEAQKAKLRRQQNTAPQSAPVVQGRPLAAGSMARLACEICIPTNKDQTEGYKLPEGSRVFVVAELEGGVHGAHAVHVKHESGIEAIVDSANLS